MCIPWLYEDANLILYAEIGAAELSIQRIRFRVTSCVTVYRNEKKTMDAAYPVLGTAALN